MTRVTHVKDCNGKGHFDVTGGIGGYVLRGMGYIITGIGYIITGSGYIIRKYSV